MRVATKLGVGYGLLILLLAGLVLYHMVAVRAMVATNETLATQVLRLSRTATDQLARLDELAENGSKYEVTRDSGYVARFESARAGFGADLDRLASLELSSEERAGVDSLKALWPRLFPASADLDDLIGAHAGPTATGGDFDLWLEDAVRQL